MLVVVVDDATESEREAEREREQASKQTTSILTRALKGSPGLKTCLGGPSKRNVYDFLKMSDSEYPLRTSEVRTSITFALTTSLYLCTLLVDRRRSPMGNSKSQMP